MPSLKCINGLCADRLAEKPIQTHWQCHPTISPNVLTLVNLLVVTPSIGYVLLHGSMSQLLFLALLRAILDIADGTVARQCNQCSRLGAMLDIVGDTVFLATIYVSTYNRIPRHISTLILVLTILSAIQAVRESRCPGRHMSTVETLVADNSLFLTPLVLIFVKMVINKS